MLDFALVREALKERGLLLERLAPHLVKPVPFLYPLQHKGWERLYAGSGVALYDAMACCRAGPAAARPPAPDPARRPAGRPCLKKDALVGALQYYDAQMDDARHTMVIARTAAAYGAQVAAAPGSSASCGGRAGRRRAGAGRRGRRASTRSGRSRSSTPPACGRTTPRR